MEICNYKMFYLNLMVTTKQKLIVGTQAVFKKRDQSILIWKIVKSERKIIIDEERNQNSQEINRMC